MPNLLDIYRRDKPMCDAQIFKSSMIFPRCLAIMLIQILNSLLPRKIEFLLKVFSKAIFLSSWSPVAYINHLYFSLVKLW